MTLSTTAWFLGLCTLALATVGCREPQSADGTIEFVVRSIEEVGASVPRGSFEVRGIDNDEHARVGIGSSAARTLSIRLPAGAYSVAWRAANRAPARESSASEWPQIVVVAPEASATVDVFVAAQSNRGALAIARTSTL